MKALLRRFPNMNRDRAGDMTCAGMMHVFDCPAPAKNSHRGLVGGGGPRVAWNQARSSLLCSTPKDFPAPSSPSRSTLALRPQKVFLFVFQMMSLFNPPPHPSSPDH